MAISWQLTHLLLSPPYFSTRPLKLNLTKFLLPEQADFMSSIILFLFFFWTIQLLTAIQLQKHLIRLKKTKVSCSKNTEWQKQGVQQLSKTKHTKTITAILLERLAQLFYLAHFSVFFLEETQMLRQMQKWDHRPQRVLGNLQKDWLLRTDAAT